MHYFHTLFLEDAEKFMATLSPREARKIIYNIELAEQTNDARLFKKLSSEIWEFRTIIGGNSIRLLAFWDKLDSKNKLVVATHGFMKKTSKTPANQIERALQIRAKYFKSKT